MYFKIKKELDNFNLEMEYEFEGGVLAIQGESGAGKTTVLNCISGLSEPSSGKIIIDNQTVFDEQLKINLPTRKRNIGYVFQNYALFPNLTVHQNIVYGIKNHSKYKEKNNRKELLDYADYIMKTFGIIHIKKKNAEKISGGEKQRVALSRAIVTKPKLLLLDEPFSALDQNTKETVYKEFEYFKKEFKIPTILITHNPIESEIFADKKILIKNGKILEGGF